VNGASFDGNTISFVPKWTANFAGQYRFPFGLYLRLEMQTLGDYYLTEDNSAKQGAFSLLNARIGYERQNWGIQVFGRNLLDQEYTANPLDLRSGVTPDQLIIQPGTPITLGIALTARF
jgi:iron complex outermembrane receptor protein